MPSADLFHYSVWVKHEGNTFGLCKKKNSSNFEETLQAICDCTRGFLGWYAVCVYLSLSSVFFAPSEDESKPTRRYLFCAPLIFLFLLLNTNIDQRIFLVDLGQYMADLSGFLSLFWQNPLTGRWQH